MDETGMKLTLRPRVANFYSRGQINPNLFVLFCQSRNCDGTEFAHQGFDLK